MMKEWRSKYKYKNEELILFAFENELIFLNLTF